MMDEMVLSYDMVANDVINCPACGREVEWITEFRPYRPEPTASGWSDLTWRGSVADPCLLVTCPACGFSYLCECKIPELVKKWRRQ